MTAHFDEFEEEMTSRSLERAYDYVDEHMITWTSIGSVG